VLILDWRRDHIQTCITEYIPALLNNFAKRLECDLEFWSWSPVGARHGTRGFHFTNVILITFKLSKYEDQIQVKLPIPNENDVFMINDTYRILTAELLDGVISVRNLGDTLSLRWQFLISALSSDDRGRMRVGNVRIPLWRIFFNVLTKEDLKKAKLNFVLSKTPIEGMYEYELPKFVDMKLYVPTPKDKLHIFQRTMINSIMFDNDIKDSLEPKLEDGVLQQIKDLIDPITAHIYRINDVKDLCKLTLKEIKDKKRENLVGSNLEFKRVRSLEVILGVFYRKLIETARQQKRQAKIRLSADYLLKCMFTDASLQRIFEYLDMGNVFKEMSLKHKIVTPVEHLPMDLRDVHSSFFENIDPYDSPDDEKCGRINYVTMDARLDKYGRFITGKEE
jgi:RNA polymerase Rpb2, domain 3